MATHANTIWTLAQVRAGLRLDGADTSRDAELERVADRVSAYIERYTGRIFVTRSVTEILDGDGRNILQLTYTPVTTAPLTGLTIVRAEGESAETIATTAYTLHAARGRVQLYAGDYFTSGFANVTATYSAGYGAQGASTLPRDIFDVGLEMIGIVWFVRDQRAESAQTVDIQGHSYTPRGGWPPQVREVLDSWRRVAA